MSQQSQQERAAQAAKAARKAEEKRKEMCAGLQRVVRAKRGLASRW